MDAMCNICAVPYCQCLCENNEMAANKAKKDI